MAGCCRDLHAANTSSYTTATASVAIDVLKLTPVITWPTPANIAYGTALSATQLNATASVPASSPTGRRRARSSRSGPAALTVTFTPTDTVNYARRQRPARLR